MLGSEAPIPQRFKPGSRVPGPGSRKNGFTLIEIMVAVAVLAIAMGALLAGMAQYTSAASRLRERTFAEMVAHNRLTEIQLDREWPDVGRSDGDVELANIEWRWFVEVKETQDDNLRRVDVRVQARDREENLATLSAFLANTGRGN